MNEIVVREALATSMMLAAPYPALFFPDTKSAERFMGFFTAHIRNPNTRRAYYSAAEAFSYWCEERGLHQLAEVKPFHIAAYIEGLKLAKSSSI